MAETPLVGRGGVKYASRDKSYFEKRGLQRYAGVWSLWALGVGAVISGHFSGWNFGFATGGWGGMLVAGIIIAIMYLGLVFSIAEMSPALPHTGAAYSFARTSMGPWGGFITGLFENVEYVLTPAVIVTFISAYFGSITGIEPAYYPVLWVVFYLIFLGLNIFGVALSYRVTLTVTLIALAGLVVFWISAFGHMDFNRWALNIGVGPDGAAVELPEGNGPWFPFGFSGVLATLPFAVWLFLAIEQVPLAAEESVDPKRDMPRGILLGFATLVLSAFMIVLLNPSIVGVGSFALSSSLEPALFGFRQIYGDAGATALGVVALVGLIASFHTILYAQGRQVYSLSRAGYFPSALSITHSKHKTPHVAMITGATLGLVVMLVIWFANGGGGDGETQLGDDIIGSVLLNMAVFGAMLSYIMQAISFILLRRNLPNIARPFRSPVGIPGAIVTIIIAAVTLFYQMQDPNFSKGVVWVIVWCVVGIIYFAAVGRNRLILSPEEEFALEHRSKA
ncbi:amino acid ABC transporter permease [Youhaiella tibetensis]|uniref:Amino acid permease n=1 Tax=Paradevosia tibetensis TaxID=1447062 RepID=A0A5B9DL18_9HYPH|nr:amino acid permease [Youhaiella tibetensis]AKR58474.1 amino acid ABC transporter permease [Devosia sp. H5989]QEE19339.1 amino acid permease [Youhaiella tibetensis]GGF34110.1 amino acid ABC transporter permease [Youhaiella tibetensis]